MILDYPRFKTKSNINKIFGKSCISESTFFLKNSKTYLNLCRLDFMKRQQQSRSKKSALISCRLNFVSPCFHVSLISCIKVYILQFGFRSKYSTLHDLINMTEAIRKSLVFGFVAYGIFVDFQRAFDTVNHEILLKKFDHQHYDFRGAVNDWSRSYLTNRK